VQGERNLREGDREWERKRERGGEGGKAADSLSKSGASQNPSERIFQQKWKIHFDIFTLLKIGSKASFGVAQYGSEGGTMETFS